MGNGCCLPRVHAGHPAASARPELPPPPSSLPPLGCSVRGSGAGSAPKPRATEREGPPGLQREPRDFFPEHLRRGRWWPPGRVWRGDVAAPRGRSRGPGRSLDGVGCYLEPSFRKEPVSFSLAACPFAVTSPAGGTGTQQRHWRALRCPDLREQTEVTGQSPPAALGGDAERSWRKLRSFGERRQGSE